MTIGRIATLVMACALALAGCAEEQETETPSDSPSVAQPSTDPEPEPSETATPYPTDELPERLADLVSEPVLPDAAREFTTEGAAAFVQYVMDATNWAVATGDVNQLLDVCSASSSYCANVSEGTASSDESWSVRYGGASTLEITEVGFYSEDRRTFVAGTVRRESYVDLDQNGTLVEQIDSSEFGVMFELTFDDQWVLEGAVSQ